jgi:hypothetical protein
MAIVNPFDNGSNGALGSLPGLGGGSYGSPITAPDGFLAAHGAPTMPSGTPQSTATNPTRNDGGSRNGGGTYASAPAPTPRTNTPAPTPPPAPAPPRTNPWAQNVTATNWDGSQMSLASPNNPNINYITGDAARNIGAAYGGNIVTGGATTGGAIDQPMYGLDLGFGDPFSAGQVQFMRDRGDSEAQIKAHLTHPAMWWANGADPNGVRNSDVNWNFSSPFANNLGTGGVNQSALARTAANQTAFGPNGSVNTQMSVPNVTPQTGNTAYGQAPTTANSGAGNTAAMSFLMQLLGPQFLQMLLGQGGVQTPQRPPALSGTARVGNRYRTYEPRYY